MMEKYANTKRCSHIAVYYPARKFEIARMTLHTGNYWHTVCGVGSAILGLETSTLTDAPEHPLCKHCQKKRAQKEELEAARGND